MNRARYLAIPLGLTLSAMAAAHHSSAGYDFTNEVIVEGVLTEYAWKNPHIYLTVRVTDSDGTTVDREIEVGGVSVMRRLGLERDSLTVGERVRVRAAPYRAGPERSLYGLDVTSSSGTVLPLSAGEESIRPPSRQPATGLEGRWIPEGDFLPYMRASAGWPLTPAGERAVAETRAQPPDAQVFGGCSVAPPPVLMLAPVLIAVEREGDTAVLDVDWNDTARIVRLRDGLAGESESRPFGHSVGRWEGDTLTIESTGFTAHPAGLSPWVPSGPDKRLTERLSLSDDRLSIDYTITLEDPQFLREPVTYSARWNHSPDVPPSDVPCDPENAIRFLRGAAAGP